MHLIALYLIIILISFDPSDPSWLQSIWTESICNIGGIIGARISDFLFFVFGGVAYLMPLFILFCGWKIYFRTIKISIWIFFLKLLEILILIFVCCGLTNLIIDDFFYFDSGGILGSILCDIFKFNFNKMFFFGLVLVLIGIIINIVYFFDYFSIKKNKIIEKKIVQICRFIFILFKKNDNHQKFYIRKQADFVSRIYPSVFMQTKSVSFKQSACNLFKKHKFYNFRNNIDKIKYVPIENDITISNKEIMKYWMTRFKLSINYVDNDTRSNKFINKIDLRNKKNENIPYIKNAYQLNQAVQVSVSKRKYTNRLVLIQNTVDKYSIFNNFISKIKPKFINQNIIKEYTSYIPIFKDIDIISNTQKQHKNSLQPIFPNISFLISRSSKNITNILKLKEVSQLIEKKLLEYRIIAKVVKITTGPVVTLFSLSLSAGIKSSKISNLSRDLARSLSVMSIRVIDIIPGTPYVGLEIPNKKRSIVYLRDIIISDNFHDISSPLALVLGKDITGKPIIKDLKNMPHLLIAGTTGSGKSIGINAMIIGILYKATPQEVRFIMIDPKILELSIYSGIPHLLKDVITNTQDVSAVLEWCVQEMEERYKSMAIFGVRNLEDYNRCIAQSNVNAQIKLKRSIKLMKNYYDSKKIYKKLPYIVVIIDEFSDLMIVTAKKIELLIIRLTQKARAAGIHLILSTQRPSVDVITGLIKANIPSRIAFTVSSKIDSRTILGQSGAESLLGMGDMLYLPPNSSTPIRIHGVYVSDQEINAVVDFWKNK